MYFISKKYHQNKNDSMNKYFIISLNLKFLLGLKYILKDTNQFMFPTPLNLLSVTCPVRLSILKVLPKPFTTALPG